MKGNSLRRILTTALLPGMAGWMGGHLLFRGSDGAGGRESSIARIADGGAHISGDAAGTDRPGSRPVPPQVVEWHRAVLEELHREPPDRFIYDPTEGKLERLLRDVFDADPAGTLAFLQNLEPRKDGQALIERLLPHIPPGQFPLVRDWIAHLPKDGFHCTAMHSVMRMWQHLDPEGLAAAVRTADGTTFSHLLRASLLSNMQPMEQIAFVQSLPRTDQEAFWSDPRPHIITRAPARASEEILRTLSGAQREQAAVHLFSRWADADPMSAMVTAHALLDDGLQFAVVSRVMEQWCGRDSFLASKFATALSPGTVRDAAAAGLALELAERDADASARWAEAIADPARRAGVVSRIQEQGEAGLSPLPQSNPPR